MPERVSSKGRPYRSFTLSGFEILVGKAATDNDHLTFNVAEPHDLWLHVAGGTPGSHVVIRNPERGAVPEEVTRCAAELAAWYSKARNAARVEVFTCAARAGCEEGARRAPAGQVQIARFKSLRVAPTPFAGATDHGVTRRSGRQLGLRDARGALQLGEIVLEFTLYALEGVERRRVVRS